MASTSKLISLQQTFGLVNKGKYTCASTVATKIACFFGSTYLCESALIFNVNFIKKKHKKRLTAAHLEGLLRIAMSNYIPEYNVLVRRMQCQASHSK